jgi:cytolysin-activating lysine-acyltransferase
MGTEEKINADNQEHDDLAAIIKKQADEVLKHLPAMGPILLLYMQSPHRRYNFVADLEWLLMPPLIRGQCKLYMKQNYPISFASWAFMSKEAEKRLLGNGGRLRPGDWQSGDRLWIIDLVAPYGGVEDMLRDLRRNEFPDRTIRLVVPDPATGGIRARKIPALNSHEKGKTTDK